MYETFILIASAVISGMPYVKNFLETSDLLKNNSSRQNMDTIEEYILGESLKMKRALSREHMLSEGVSEEYVDVVIEEIRGLIPKLKDRNELRRQCGCDEKELVDLLWREYCSFNDKKICAEYENDLKKGLFVVAKSWDEPVEEGAKACIEILKRLDSITGSISVNITEMKNMLWKAEMSQTMFETREETHASDEQGEYKPEKKEESEETMVLPDELKQEAVDAEEISPDEITICLAALPDEFQDDIVKLQKFVEEQNRSQNMLRLNLQCYAGEAPQDIQNCKYCYLLVGTTVEKWMQETYELVYHFNSSKTLDKKSVELHMCFKTMTAGKTTPAEHDGMEEWKQRYSKDYGRNPVFPRNGI